MKTVIDQILRDIDRVNAFLRVRVGIGRPAQGEVTDYVLDTFDPEQQDALPALLDRAADAVEAILEHGLALAANRFNRRPKPVPTEPGEAPENDTIGGD